MQPLVLLYNLTADTPAGKALRRIFLMRGIACRDIPEDRLAETIGSLLSDKGFVQAADDSTQAEPVEITDEIREAHLLLMCNFDEAMLDEFLADMRAEGVRIPYKAMLTETNIGFSAARLIQDISREHAMMQMMQQMQSR